MATLHNTTHNAYVPKHTHLKGWYINSSVSVIDAILINTTARDSHLHTMILHNFQTL